MHKTHLGIKIEDRINKNEQSRISRRSSQTLEFRLRIRFELKKKQVVFDKKEIKTETKNDADIMKNEDRVPVQD